jgi:hypothetical protein
MNRIKRMGKNFITLGEIVESTIHLTKEGAPLAENLQPIAVPYSYPKVQEPPEALFLKPQSAQQLPKYRLAASLELFLGEQSCGVFLNITGPASIRFWRCKSSDLYNLPVTPQIKQSWRPSNPFSPVLVIENPKTEEKLLLLGAFWGACFGLQADADKVAPVGDIGSDTTRCELTIDFSDQLKVSSPNPLFTQQS